MPLAVTLYSTLTNYRGSLPVRLFIIDGGIHALNRLRIERILGEVRAVAAWLQPDWQPVRHLVVSERYPASIYLRLLIPTLLPPWVEKAIYLDSDLVVGASIGDLWDVEMGPHSLLAVQDDGAPTVGSPWGLVNYRELGLGGQTWKSVPQIVPDQTRQWLPMLLL
jgi:lipopolysaccharide biosynthesis glycosyltransferase